MFNEVMKLLGYTSYMAQGGDWYETTPEIIID